MADELMVEKRSNLSVLIIEDNIEFAANALKTVGKGAVIVAHAKTLEEAKELLKATTYDAILSDVHVPAKNGNEPAPIVSEMMDVCRETGTPVCFVTRADHHGMLDLGDEGYVSLKATTQGRVLQTQIELSRKEPTETDLFRHLKTTESKTERSGSKTTEIWSIALQMALNAKAEPTPIGRAIRQVGKIGLGVVAEKGMAKVVPKK